MRSRVCREATDRKARTHSILNYLATLHWLHVVSASLLENWIDEAERRTLAPVRILSQITVKAASYRIRLIETSD